MVALRRLSNVHCFSKDFQENVKAYEIVLRMGVRFIEVDILDGNIHDDLGLVPLACNGTTRLDLITEKDSPAICQVGHGSQRDQTARVYQVQLPLDHIPRREVQQREQTSSSGSDGDHFWGDSPSRTIECR